MHFRIRASRYFSALLLELHMLPLVVSVCVVYKRDMHSAAYSCCMFFAKQPVTFAATCCTCMQG